MSSKRLFIVCCFLLLTSLHYGLCCDLAEVGQQYIINSTAYVPSDVRVVWRSWYTDIYDSALSNPNLFPNKYIGTRTQLTIKNLTIANSRDNFGHEFDHFLEYKCLDVYKRASIPTCEPVTLNGTEIRTKCTTAQVYPEAKCQFTLQNGGTDRRDIKDGTSYITYTHNRSQPGEYYSTSCTLQYPVDGLNPGNWTVKVNMYPGLAGLSLAQGSIGQAFNTLSLWPPRNPPMIYARSSQNGDILVEGDNVTVTCEVSGGYPSVQSVTLNCVHDQSVTNNGTSATLTLQEIGLSYNETNCTCQATHVTGSYDLMGVLPLIVLKLPTQAPEHVQNRVSFVDYIRTRVSDHWEDSEIVIN